MCHLMIVQKLKASNVSWEENIHPFPGGRTRGKGEGECHTKNLSLGGVGQLSPY